jgi:hypothetical protein
MPVIKSLALNLFADYFQFCLQDEDVDTDWSDAWTEEAVSRMLAVAPRAVAVGTARNMDVPVVVELHDAEPDRDFQAWERVAECALEVVSHSIVIMGNEYFPEAPRMNVSAGLYRVRVAYAGLSSISEDGLTGDDRYRVQLWIGSACAPHVLK